jgi:hypothetical protein
VEDDLGSVREAVVGDGLVPGEFLWLLDHADERALLVRVARAHGRLLARFARKACRPTRIP